MPVPELAKDEYSPEEVHSLINETLGTDAAMQFRMFYNQVAKVPPHDIKVRPLGSSDAGAKQYQFRMSEYMDLLNLPQEVLDFIMVLGDLHGGGGSDNMGWVNLHFKDIQSPEGNTIKVAIADEIQSDFIQRVSRIRKMFAGTLNKPLGHETTAFAAMKRNPELVQEVKIDDGTSKFVPTKTLNNAINRIESTSYSQILNYLFNKAVGFAKQEGATQLWIPDSEMKVDEWQTNAQGSVEDLRAHFKRVYDDMSVSYDAVKQLEQQVGVDERRGKHWVINLETMPEIRMAKKKPIRLAAYWENPEMGINSDTWKPAFDKYVVVFNKVNQEMNPDIGPDFDMAVKTFVEQMLPEEAYDDQEWVAEFKAYLKEKHDYDLSPELASFFATRGPELREAPEQEKVEDAPSVEELESQFTFSSKKNKRKY